MLKPATYESLRDTFPADWPDIEYLVLDAYFGAGTDSSIVAGNVHQYVAASVGLVATFSRGNVTINSTDTANNSIISPNWLSDPRDQDVAVAAFRRGRQLFSTDAIRPIVKAEAFPGQNITTDSDILDIIKKSANSIYNAAGTNRMGKADDPMAVVDSKGRVIGVGGLRVVDASIFPFLPPGQPSATVCEYLCFNGSNKRTVVLMTRFFRRCRGGEDCGGYFALFLSNNVFIMPFVFMVAGLKKAVSCPC